MPQVPDHQMQVVALAARQAALEEMLVAYNRVVAKVRSSESRGAALAAGFIELHDWLSEAGRESAVELALLKQTAKLHKDQAGLRSPPQAGLARLKALLTTSRGGHGD